MSAGFSLLRIEARRSVGPFFVPVILAASYIMWNADLWSPFLWIHTSDATQQTLAVTGPTMASVAAWMAGRDRRRRTTELLETTARPVGSRRLSQLGGTAVWGLLALVAFAAFLLIRTALHATWGGPLILPLVVTAAAIAAHTAVGFAIGTFLPSRFVAPLVAVAAFAVRQALGAKPNEWYGYLPAQPEIHRYPHVNLLFDPSLGQLLFYFGLLGLGLAALILRSRTSIPGSVGCLVSVALAVSGCVVLWGGTPRYDPAGLTGARNGWGNPVEARAATYTPVCQGAPVAVCAHPAYQSLLPDAAERAAKLAAPFVGLPSAPKRVELSSWGASRAGGGDRFYLGIDSVVDALVQYPTALSSGTPATPAQLAIHSWLAEQAEGYSQCEDLMPSTGPTVGQPTPETCEATERFAKLSDVERRRWLEQHYAELRAGKLKLEDLP